MRFFPLYAVLVVVPSLVACVVETRSDPGYESPPPAPVSPPQTPLVVSIDTNQTMSQVTGGDGVGVFVEYQAGGHWHVSTTCDTNKSGQNCSFDLKITPDTGVLANYVATPGSNNPANLASLGTNGIEVTALSTDQIASVTFDADPSVRLTIDASVSGLRSYVDSTGQQQSFFFFVESGKINGGFTGILSNPLTFEPSSP